MSEKNAFRLKIINQIIFLNYFLIQYFINYSQAMINNITLMSNQIEIPTILFTHLYTTNDKQHQEQKIFKIM